MAMGRSEKMPKQLLALACTTDYMVVLSTEMENTGRGPVLGGFP